MEKSPDAFRTIREVADAMDLPQHVLRFWETRFPQIRPLKRAGGRRYYRPDDIERLRLIKRLLYDEGYTIKGVQKLFKEQGAQALTSGAFATGALSRPSEAGSANAQENAPATVESRASPRSGTRGRERREIVAESPTPRPVPAEDELSALRQVLADIRHASRLLSQARSSGA